MITLCPAGSLSCFVWAYMVVSVIDRGEQEKVVKKDDDDKPIDQVTQ